MSESHLRLVQEAGLYDLGRAPETLQDRVRRAHRETQLLACEESEEFRRQLLAVIEKANAIVEGGEAFPVGVREQARRVATDLPLIAQTIQALCERKIRELSSESAPPVWSGDR